MNLFYVTQNFAHLSASLTDPSKYDIAESITQYLKWYKNNIGECVNNRANYENVIFIEKFR